MKKITANDPETKSTDLTAENLEQLKALFPEAFTEGKLDFEVLRQLLGSAVDEREEKYGLNWHGKRRARQIAITPSTGTLRPCPDESVDWDNTQNLMIEGDNLEVLKLLQRSYAGKVKLIYIDPPYNTGKDFVYPDNFQDNIKNYLELTGQIEGGQKISSNTESSGRFHTDWLNMMYPRLKLARALLRDDGVMFISIDDAEHGNIRHLCDEIFGEENFAGVIKRRAARKTAFLSKRMTDMCDYVIVYVKSEDAPPLTAGQVSDGTRPVFNEGNATSVRILRAGAIAKCGDGIYKKGKRAARSMEFELLDELAVSGGVVSKDVCVQGPWRINQEVLDKTLFVTRNGGLRRTMLPEELDQAKLLNDLLDDKSCYNELGTEEVNELLDIGVFSNPKPVGLLSYLISSAGVAANDLVLDFFAGSGTTGHAVLQQNAVDGGNRRFVLVQLPEPLHAVGGNQQAAAEFCKKHHRPLNIAELTKERLRRAANRLKTEKPVWKGDCGFRVYKLDSSNLRAWEPKPDNLEQSLADAMEHIKPDRSEQDVLFELLLKLGLELTVPIESKTLAGKTVHSIGAGTLIACLTEKVTAQEVEPLALGIVDWHAKLAPAGDTQVVFRDSAFADDVAKTNLTAILQQHSLENVRSL